VSLAGECQTNVFSENGAVSSLDEVLQHHLLDEFRALGVSLLRGLRRFLTDVEAAAGARPVTMYLPLPIG
jgi:hypothetical protein